LGNVVDGAASNQKFEHIPLPRRQAAALCHRAQPLLITPGLALLKGRRLRVGRKLGRTTPRFNPFVSLALRDVPRVDTGVFGAMMDVSLVNRGPFTLCLDTDNL